jgi:hypothetical protein
MPRRPSLSRRRASRRLKLQPHTESNHKRKKRPTSLQPNQLKRNAQVGARIRGADGDAAAAGGEEGDRDRLAPRRADPAQPERRRSSMLQKVMDKPRLSWLLPPSLRRWFPKAA